jgi:hypothetical protein
MELKSFEELKNATEGDLITAINSCLALHLGHAPDTRQILGSNCLPGPTERA